MIEKKIIFTISGVRGIVGSELNSEIAKKIGIAYGLWLKEKPKIVIIGRDTRPSGEPLEKAIIEGLLSANCDNIINLGICPTPLIIFMKNKLKVPGGIIISGSHNPPEWNGLKILSLKTFLNNNEVEEIKNILRNIELNKFTYDFPYSSEKIKNLNAFDDYFKNLKRIINFKKIRNHNTLSVGLDTGAGAGKYATPKILEKIGCDVKLINNEFDENSNFPRVIEPIEANLKDLIQTVLKESLDIGFAHDCDADRIAIIGDDGICYPEDIGLALIADYYFNQYKHDNKKVIFITNLASSLIFEALAEKYNAEIIRTPVGERYLAEKMDYLMKERHQKSSMIFGGEGSCGGVMIPHFNNTRDGIFAAAKIVEILVETQEKISKLVSNLPKFYSFREYINIENKNLEKILSNLKETLISEGQVISQFDIDIRIAFEHDWFVLVHPSNTEPIIRVISEAKSENMAKLNLEKMVSRLKIIIS